MHQLQTDDYIGTKFMHIQLFPSVMQAILSTTHYFHSLCRISKHNAPHIMAKHSIKLTKKKQKKKKQLTPHPQKKKQ